MNSNEFNKSESGPTALKPKWLRLPEASRLFGPSRSKLYELIRAGKIRSVSLREEGQTKGTRLISYASLAGYLESLATGNPNEVQK